MKSINPCSVGLLLLLSLLVVLVLGCDNGTNAISDLDVRFTLTDVQGNPKSTVRTGERFYLTLSVKNLTESVQMFNYTPPEFIFKILQGDSLRMPSYEGYGYPQVIVDDSLATDSIRRGSWLAPTSPIRPAFRLSPGRYEAEGWWSADWMSRGVYVTSKIHFLVSD
jgi:hypothetical protein